MFSETVCPRSIDNKRLPRSEIMKTEEWEKSNDDVARSI